MDVFNALLAQMAPLSKQMQNMKTKAQVHAPSIQILSCDFCGNFIRHSIVLCKL